MASRSINNVLRALFATGLMFCGVSGQAAITAEEAKQLGGATLTEFGAERAGNKDGTIPPYTGGLEKLPAYDPKRDQAYIDPFKGEKALYSINAQNAAQYAEFLTPGTQELLKVYPGYRIDVYPSHRTMRYPAWFLENTLKNATTAKLGGKVEGDNLMGADKDGLPYRGIPFSIPKTGYEVLWNKNARYSAAVSHNLGCGFLVDSSGRVVNLGSSDEYFVHPWSDKSGKLSSLTPPGTYFGFSAQLVSPPSAAGIVFLNYYTAYGEDGGQKVWFYTPGQRRVRLAPEFAYDVPIASYGSATFWDEIYGYLGRMDRFSFKLVGKKEILLPYNAFAITNTVGSKEALGPKFVNPSVVRWEKHRVWVVDGTLKPGMRHAFSRRVFYIDEDSWAVLGQEGYDGAGKLYRITQTFPFPTYDTGGLNIDSWVTYDFTKGNYFVPNIEHNLPGRFVRSHDSMEGLTINLTAQAVAAASVR